MPFDDCCKMGKYLNKTLLYCLILRAKLLKYDYLFCSDTSNVCANDKISIISAGANGDPRSRVCARLALRSAPHDTNGKIEKLSARAYCSTTLVYFICCQYVPYEGIQLKFWLTCITGKGAPFSTYKNSSANTSQTFCMPLCKFYLNWNFRHKD